MSDDKSAVSTSGAPQNDAPYSQAIVSGDLVFVSGQGPTDPETMAVVDGGIGAQTERTLRNVQNILAAADAELGDVVKTRVYLADMDDYDAVNEVYGEFFDGDPPARVCIEAARLPNDIGVEIEATARR
jgi:2-iminobutanoate/2-iminopropanoate deaminase